MRDQPAPVQASRATAVARLREAGLLTADPGAGESGPEQAGPVRISAGALGSVRRALGPAGFAEVASTEDGTGRRFAGYDPATDQWIHLDVVQADGTERTRTTDRRPTESLPGLVVAILGPDGAGKTTLTEATARAFELPVRRYYAGLYPAGRRRHRLPGLETLDVLRRQSRLARAAARGRRAGALVLFDRFAYDARLPLPPGAGRRSRIRRWVIARSTATPDLVIVLDAPAEVLLGRREEHPREVIEAQRARYAELARTVPDGVVVDASDDAETVRRAVTALIWSRVVVRRRSKRD